MVARTLAELRQEYKPYDTLPSRIDHKASHETSKKPSFYRGLQLLHDAEFHRAGPSVQRRLGTAVLKLFT